MEQKYEDYESSAKMARNKSPDLEAGFNGEIADSSINFPSKVFGGRDIMSIVMKRQVGGTPGGAVIEDDTEPVVKRARMTDIKRESSGMIVAKEEITVKQEDTSSDICDSEISFSEIKANIDLLNGKESFTTAAKVCKIKSESNDNEGCVEKNSESTVSDSKQSPVHVQTEPDAGTDQQGPSHDHLVDIIPPNNSLENVDSAKPSGYYITSTPKPESFSSSFESAKIEHKTDLENLNEFTNIVSKETFVERSFNLPSDLDVLAAAAERRQQIDTTWHISEKPEQTGSSNSKKANGEKRKSRKQNTPRRISHIATDFPEPSEELDTDEVEEKHRSEKSRKQNKPQRFTGEFSDFDDVKFDIEGKALIKDSSKEKDIYGGQDEIENTDSAEETYYTDHCDEEEKLSIYQKFSLKNMTGIPNIQPYIEGQDAGRPMLPVSPFHNEMLVTLSQSLYQNASENMGKDQKGISDLEENLDVVRRLREIRFYKYRKISVSEKQEIASYAKLHSVSAAAAHFGVSKSAVSMWTRTDFSDMKDELGKRKRNCMLGNEKFEQLLERVKMEKGNKFKGLTKQDKFEVSRYAKLVGVREMARCLGIALGTVSGWMRQFPYTIKPANQDDESLNTSTELNEYSFNNSQDVSMDSSVKLENDESLSFDSEDQVRASYTENENLCTKDEHSNPVMKSQSSEMDEKQSQKCEQLKPKYCNGGISDSWDDDANSKASTETLEYDEDTANATEDSENQSVDRTEGQKSDESESQVQENFDKNDELDEMIAETLMTPDIDRCYENIKDQIKDTPLENDEFFESLFRRVLSCRTDKYKTLRASEKLEVVRYAKRIGVRKVAKLLGLATGTLSGWNTKYQAHLGLTMMGNSNHKMGTDTNKSAESSPAREIPASSLPNGLVNIFTPDCHSNSLPSTPQSSSLLDNAEKSEVTAIKFLLKDQFPVLQEKIAIARQIKFKNIKPAEKIEIVKCAKLVGIRPTARVLGMPIGTLSGWITKYTNTLHPVYHIDNAESVDYSTGTVPDMPADPNSVNELYRSELIGRNSPLGGVMPAVVNSMTSTGLGLVSGMPNSFSQTFISSLNSASNKNSVTEDHAVDYSYEESSSNDKIQTTSAVANEMGIMAASASGVGNINLDEETKRMAEQYVKMFQQAQILKFH